MLKTQKIYLPVDITSSDNLTPKQILYKIGEKGSVSTDKTKIHHIPQDNPERIWTEEKEMIVLTQEQAKEMYTKDEVKSMIQSIYSEFAESPLSMHNTYGLKHIIEIEIEGHIIKPIKIFKEK